MSDASEPRLDFDVFLSYAPEDEEFALGVIAAALEESGAAVHHSGRFQPGVPILDELEKALQSCRFVVIVLSPAYTTDRMARFERVVAQHLTIEDERRRLIPAIYRPSPTPDLLTRSLVSLDFTDTAQWGRELVRLAGAVGTAVSAGRTRPACPYPGMVPFDEHHHEFFFGREIETEAIARRIRVERRLLIVGPSGSGKSSLVFAGVVPALLALEQSSAERWVWRSFRPGRDPNVSLGVALAVADDRQPDLEAAVSEIVVAEQADRLLIVADQLEELFTLAGPGSERFGESLRALSSMDSCAVIATMRADFYAELMQGEMWDLFEFHRFDVRPLGADALRTAIRMPALQERVYVETALVEKLVDDAASEPGMLPFVQETLRQLWDHIEWSLLPLSAYVLPRDSYGDPPRTGLHLAIETHANAALGALESAELRMIARRILLRLVQSAEGRPHVRRQRTLSELEEVHPDRNAVRATVDHLVSARLLTSTSSAEAGSQRKIDLAHEALIVGWTRLQEWIESSRAAEKRRARLADQADEWERLRRRGGLLDEVELGVAQRWMDSRDAEQVGVDTHIREFVVASRNSIEERHREAAAEEERLRNRRLRTTRRWLGAVTAVAAVAVIAAVAALVQRNSARSAQEETKAVELAAVSSQLSDQSLDGALLLALESYRLRPTPEARASLTTMLSRLPALERILRSHDAEVRAVAVAPDGSMFASAGRDHRINLWSPTGELLSTLDGHTDAVQGLAFSTSGTMLISGSDDRTVRRWDVSTGRQLGADLEGHAAALRGVAVDSHDRWVASASHDGTVRVWELVTGAVVDTVTVTSGQALDVSFDPAGELLAVATSAADGRGEIIVVSMSNLEVAQRISFGVPVRAVSFDPVDGSRLALGLNDGSVALWDLVSPNVVEVGNHEGSVFDVAFSADGTSLASAGRARTILVHDMMGPPTPVAEWLGHSGDVRSIAFLPDGRLISASRDRSVMVWNPAATHPFSETVATVAPSGGVLYAPESDSFLWRAVQGDALGSTGGAGFPDVTFDDVAVTAFAHSPVTPALAVGYLDGTLTLLDANSPGTPWHQLPALPAPIAGLAFSADGEMLALGDTAGGLSLWNVEARRMIDQTALPDFGVVDVALDLEGSRLIATDTSGALWQWRLEERTAPELIADNRVRAGELALDPGEGLLAVGTTQDRIQVWDLGHDPMTVRHEIDIDGSVVDLATADGQVAAASDAGTVGVWDLESGRSFGTIPGPDVAGVALSGDGNVLAVAGPDGLVLWDLRVEGLVELACRVANRNLTESEWAFYVGAEYRETCPGLTAPGQ